MGLIRASIYTEREDRDHAQKSDRMKAYNGFKTGQPIGGKVEERCMNHSI